MAQSSSKRVIFAALAGNTLIALTKYAAAWFTGSSAMFSEAIHSTVDTGNQALLLHGLRRAARAPDERHPFGYAQELYFWAFVVAILIFAVGSGISLYEGVERIRHPAEITDVYVNYVVLGLAMIFEGAACTVAFKEFNRSRGTRGLLEALRASKDPSIFTVLLEDTAAMLGLVAAALGIALGQAFGLPELDGVASLVIAAILGTAALLLAHETKGLLIGEGADPEVVARLKRIIAAEDGILRTNEILTMHLGPRDVLVTISVDFRDSLSSAEVESAISTLERRIKTAQPEVKRVFVEAQSWRGHHNSR